MVMVNRSAVVVVNRNTIVKGNQDSLFRETLVRFLKKLYRSGNEKKKNVQTDSSFQTAGVFQE